MPSLLTQLTPMSEMMEYTTCEDIVSVWLGAHANPLRSAIGRSSFIDVNVQLFISILSTLKFRTYTKNAYGVLVLSNVEYINMYILYVAVHMDHNFEHNTRKLVNKRAITYNVYIYSITYRY